MSKLKIDKVLHLSMAPCIGDIPETWTLVVSTAHLPGHEIDSLFKGTKTGYGLILSEVKDNSVIIGCTFNAAKYHESKHLKALMELAVKNNCHNLKLSFDGPIVEGFETFSY